MFPGLDLYYTDVPQHLTPAGEELDCLHRDLSVDVCSVCCILDDGKQDNELSWQSFIAIEGFSTAEDLEWIT